MSDRKEILGGRTLKQLTWGGLYPCDVCLQEIRRCYPEPLSATRMYYTRTSDTYPVGSRTCSDCGCTVCPDGALWVSPSRGWEMCEHETEKDSRRYDASTYASPQVPKGGELRMRHGDSKTTFNTGAQRDTTEGKGRPSLISPDLIHRLGVNLAKGAEHYGEDNWAKCMPYRRTADSMIRHIGQWLAGDAEEDHLAAIAFGVMCLMHYETMVSDPKADGFLKSMDDRCPEFKKILASLLTSPPSDATIEVVDSKQNCCDWSTTGSGGICAVCQLKKAEGKLTYD